MDLFQQGNAAFVEDNYADAIKLYSQALAKEPTNAKILEARANAHLKMKKHMDALQDASKAAELDPKSAKALVHKGRASFYLEEYEAAKEAFDAGLKLEPGNAQLRLWSNKCQAELDEEQAALKATPSPASAPKPQTSQAPSVTPSSKVASAASASAAAAPSNSSLTSQPLLNPKLPEVPERRFRHQWYQLHDKVTVDVYAKNIKKEQVSISFEEQRLRVMIKEEGKEDYTLDVELHGKIKPEDCRYEVLKTKIEITLLKADGVHWPDLEKSGKPSLPAPGPPAPSQYPSSKSHKDWNKLEAEVKELEQKGELQDGDPLNNFFKKIFAQGDEAQQRAMMKSYQESNGTVLSTNWAEVGSKKVECTPPDGMEAQKWNK